MMAHEQTVIVTGATSGFGDAMARLYAKAGARVVAIGRNRKKLNELSLALGARCTSLECDVGDMGAVVASLATLPEELSQPTVLINNAGLSVGNTLVPNEDMADWNRMVDTNIRGVLNMTHAVLPGMVSRNYGDVVNISSIASTIAYPGGNVYGASKAFVRQFTLNLRADLLGKNVRAICIEPGTARTGFAAVRLGSEKAAEDFYNQPNLLEAQDVAEIAFFCTALPRRVNVNMLQVMAISQAFSFPAMAADMPLLEPDNS